MSDNRGPEGVPSEAPTVRRFFRRAGIAYGVVFTLGFALLAWGYDAFVMASNGADLAWTKLLLGLPLVLAIGCLVGWLSTVSSSAVVSALLWAGAGALFALIAGRLPYEGNNLAAWVAERRLWGVDVFPAGRAATVNTVVVVIVGAGLGALVGFFEGMAVDGAWGRATSAGRMSVGSWLVLFICIPWVLLLAGAVEEQIDEAARAAQQAAGEVIELVLEGGGEEEARARGISYSAVASFVDQFSEEYVVHLVQYDPTTLTSAYVDAVFDNGFAMRCATGQYPRFLTLDRRLLSCIDISARFSGWMGDLVHAGLHGERRWLEERWQQLVVMDEVVAWLEDHSDQLAGSYEVSRAGQRGGWVFVSARFDTGFEMTCRFQGMALVTVDQCVETGPSSGR